MRSILKRSTFLRATAGALYLVAIASPGAVQAQTAHYPKGEPEVPPLASLPDWDGLWERDGDNVWDNRIPVGQPQEPPYNPEYRELAKTPGPRGSAPHRWRRRQPVHFAR